MFRGIASAARAMKAQVLNQEVIANNLANADTLAYSRSTAVFSSFGDILASLYQASAFPQVLGTMSSGTIVQEVRNIPALGPVEVTGEPLDVALPAGIYLAIQGTSGTRYTRRGDFGVSPDGYLTVAGGRVLGEGGVIHLDPLTSIEIREDGTVLADGVVQDVLCAYAFGDEGALQKEGSSLYRTGDQMPSKVESYTLMTRALERSAIDPVSEMVGLIYAMRLYEAAQKAIQSHDETLQMATGRVGHV